MTILLLKFDDLDWSSNFKCNISMSNCPIPLKFDTWMDYQKLDAQIG